MLIMITLYTDGACWPNPGGKGGWGYVILKNGIKILENSGTIPRPCTNNRAEMTAAIKGLEVIEPNESVLLISDSRLLLNCGAGKWKRKKNLDLWIEFDRLVSDKLLTHKWVRGHNGDEHNERCDKLASIGVGCKIPTFRKKDLQYV